MMKMIKRILGVCTMILLAACTQQPAAKKGMVYATTLSFKTERGWGYEIYLDGKRYIRQPYIPAVAGNMAFTSKEDAEKVAALVVKKLGKERLPSISTQELQALHITIP